MLVLSEDQRMLMESARGAVAANAPIVDVPQVARRRVGRRLLARVLAPMRADGLDRRAGPRGIRRHRLRHRRRRADRARDGANARALAISVHRGHRGERAAQRRLSPPKENVAAADREGGSDHRRRDREIAAALRGQSQRARARAGGSTASSIRRSTGHVADALLIAAEIENGGTRLFLAPAEAHGASSAMRARWSTGGASPVFSSRASRSAERRSARARDTRARARRRRARWWRPRSAASRRRRSRARSAISRSASSSSARSAASRPYSTAPRACISRSRMPGRPR